MEKYLTIKGIKRINAKIILLSKRSQVKEKTPCASLESWKQTVHPVFLFLTIMTSCTYCKFSVLISMHSALQHPTPTPGSKNELSAHSHTQRERDLLEQQEERSL